MGRAWRAGKSKSVERHRVANSPTSSSVSYESQRIGSGVYAFTDQSNDFDEKNQFHKVVQSTVVTGAAPLIVASTTVVTNFNADKLDGADVGTSGAVIPLLNAVNDWSADQEMQTTSKWRFHDTSNYIHASDSNTLLVNAAVDINFGVAGTPEVNLTASALTSPTGIDLGLTGTKWGSGWFSSLVTASTFSSLIGGSSTPPMEVASTARVINLNADTVDGIEAAAMLRVDGSLALSANWDAGAFEIRAETFESDVTTGTAAFTIASTTVIPNLNASLLEGKATGTSGTVIPLLDGANDWSGVQEFQTNTKLQFRDTGQYIQSSGVTALDISGGTKINIRISGTPVALFDADVMDVVGKVRSAGCQADTDHAGTASTTTYVHGTTTIPGIGTVAALGNIPAVATAAQATWQHVRIGTTLYYIAVWT